MNSLPNLSHRLFAAALACQSDTSFFSTAGKKSASVATADSWHRHQHEPKNFTKSVSSSPPQHWLAAAGADGV